MKKHEPVTVLYSRTAKPGKEKAYEAWNRELVRLCEKQPGHLMTSVVAEGDRRYLVLQRFESHDALQAWLRSPVRTDRLDELEELTDEAPHPTEMKGMETWFRLPGRGGKGHIPRWKMALVIFSVIYVFVLVFNTFLMPKMGHLPLPIRAAVFPIIVVPAMTYIIMPRLTKLLHGWLYR